jgi:threonine dehydrogenase-like Zn-dependent dehydrogenase
MQTVYSDISIPRILATRALSKLWRGAYLSGISPVRFEELPDPPLPGPHFVRVRNRLALICGTDLHFVEVRGDPSIAPAALPSTQRIYLGHEICGEVVEVGTEVTQVSPGDRVVLRYPAHSCRTLGVEPYCRQCAQGEWRLCENQAASAEPATIGGGWGDQFIAHEHLLYHPPEALNDEEAALIEATSCGLHVVLRAMPQPGDKVMVLGCGSMGLMTIRALHALVPEAQVTCLARYQFQAEAARRFGAQEVHVGEDGYQVTAATTGARLYRGQMGSAILLGGFDVVYDCVGLGRTLTDALRWARAGGRVALVGDQLSTLHVDLTPTWYQEVELLAPAAHSTELWEGEKVETYEVAARLFQAGKMTTDGLITHRFPLSRWRQAVETAMNKRQHQSIKVAFEFE